MRTEEWGRMDSEQLAMGNLKKPRKVSSLNQQETYIGKIIELP
jgi:hypothetical protein